jgi:vitellogenic carboxypeptidase-like protein
MQQGYADIIFNAGLLSPPEYVIAQSYVANITRYIENEDYVSAYLTWDAFLNGDSTPGGAWFTNVTGLTNYFNIASETPPQFAYYAQYVTSQAVRTAIGVGNNTYNDGNLQVELALKGDVMFSQKPRLEAILSAGKQVLIYNGALDLICGAPLTERYVPLLNWPGNIGWNASPKVLWHDKDFPDGSVISGYSRSFQNLNQVVVRAAGHMAPFDQPSRSLDLITRFIEQKEFN